MSIDRRDLLKVFSTAAAGAALDGLLAEEMLPQATARPPREQATPAQSVPERGLERAPERLLQSEPQVSLDAGGSATIAWETVIPTQGGTIYIGVPNDEIALDWPIYNANQGLNEPRATLIHSLNIEVRTYLSRSAPHMLQEGGTLARS